jgi:lysozyme family protein
MMPCRVSRESPHVYSGVNAGPQRARLWFKHSLNVLNRRAKDYPDVDADGEIGPRTLAAIQALRRRRGEAKARQLMLKALTGLQFPHYFKLADGGTKFEDFMVGWVDSRIGGIA